MDAVLSLVASPVGQYVLALIAGFVLKANPNFLNKWIPLTQQGLNLALAVIAAFAGVIPAHAGAFSFLKPVGSTLIALIAQSVAMTLLATGTHSAVKNTIEGVQGKK